MALLLTGGTCLAWDGRDAVVEEVLQIARQRALNRNVPDWALVERKAQALVSAEAGEAGRTAAIRHILAALDDRHSFYVPPAKPGDAATPGSPHALLNSRPAMIAVADLQPGRPGRLVINGWAGGREKIPDASRTVRDQLNKALSASACGLVIDVSTNGGGNMWPMMGGIAPLYDEGPLETFEDADGKRMVVSVGGGALRMDGSEYPRVELPPVPVRPKRIALVLGRRTASSGEILALGFKGQANVRSYGQATAGQTSANQSMKLSNGGLLALTTARILDRSGRVHTGPVQPDVPTDQPVDAALDWVAAGCG